MRAIAHSSSKPPGRFGFISPTYTQSKDVACEYLKSYSRPFLSETPNESELRVDLWNGSRIRLYGATTPTACAVSVRRARDRRVRGQKIQIAEEELTRALNAQARALRELRLMQKRRAPRPAGRHELDAIADGLKKGAGGCGVIPSGPSEARCL
jgi:hypothetical protein